MSFAANESQLSELKQQAIDWPRPAAFRRPQRGGNVRFADWLSQDNAHSTAFAEAENLFNDMVNTARSSASRAETHTR